MTFKEAKAQGISNGEGIVRCNYYHFLEENEERLEGNRIEEFVSFCLDAESDHFRQYSPFELFANEVNQHRNAEACWQQYEDGVELGIRKELARINN